MLQKVSRLQKLVKALKAHNLYFAVIYSRCLKCHRPLFTNGKAINWHQPQTHRCKPNPMNVSAKFCLWKLHLMWSNNRNQKNAKKFFHGASTIHIPLPSAKNQDESTNNWRHWATDWQNGKISNDPIEPCVIPQRQGKWKRRTKVYKRRTKVYKSNLRCSKAIV